MTRDSNSYSPEHHLIGPFSATQRLSDVVNDGLVFSDDDIVHNCGCILSNAALLKEELPSLAICHHASCPWSSYNPDSLPKDVKKLSQGLESAVYRLQDSRGVPVAWKITDKARLNTIDGLNQQRLEAHLMMSCRSQAYIAHLLCCTETPTHLSLFFEFISGGDLYSAVGSKTVGELDARAIAHDCLNGLAYLHARGIVHGDIKPHNILLHEMPADESEVLCSHFSSSSLSMFINTISASSSSHNDSSENNHINDHLTNSNNNNTAKPSPYQRSTITTETPSSSAAPNDNHSLSPPVSPPTSLPLVIRARLTDLGMAHILPSPHASKTCIELMGTTGYLAPELLRKEAFNTKVDIFALGVVLFSLLGGYEPFFPISTCCDTRRNGREVVSFDERVFADVSSEAKDLVAWMLSTDANVRPNAEECLNHPWFSSHTERDTRGLAETRPTAEWTSPHLWEWNCLDSLSKKTGLKRRFPVLSAEVLACDEILMTTTAD